MITVASAVDTEERSPVVTGANRLLVLLVSDPHRVIHASWVVDRLLSAVTDVHVPDSALTRTVNGQPSTDGLPDPITPAASHLLARHRAVAPRRGGTP
jgi:hypothetical protein